MANYSDKSVLLKIWQFSLKFNEEVYFVNFSRK